MDFIEHLPSSSSYTSILVVVDRLSKQGIFILTYDTISSPDLVKLFVSQVFSKHGVPSHQPLTEVQSLPPISFTLLEKPLA